MISPTAPAGSLYAAVRDLGTGELIAVDEATRPAIPPDCLLAEFGMVLTHVGRGRARAAMTVGRKHLNQRGAVQAGALVAFADACAGWATYAAVEHGAFTTLELRCNLLRAAREGERLVAEAQPIHIGRCTAVFEVDIRCDDTGARAVARFGCTQLVLDGLSEGAAREGRG